MTTAALDDFLVRYAPGPRIALSPALASARAALARATTLLGQIPDPALPGPWPRWGPDGEVRYGFYRIVEILEAARLDAEDAVRRAESRAGVGRSQSGDLTALATAARWDLQGRLAVIDEDTLDADPGGGEWTVRQTLAHTISGQRSYGWFTAYWLAQAAADANELPARVPEELGAELPDEEIEGRGALGEIRERFDTVLDASAEVLGRLDARSLAMGARWMGNPVTVGFRIGRWSSHIREHTVQVDKTFDMVGWRPSETDRLIGLVHGAYGKLEAALYTVPSDLLETADETGRSALSVFGDALASVETTAHEAVAAASEPAAS